MNMEVTFSETLTVKDKKQVKTSKINYSFFLYSHSGENEYYILKKLF